MTDTSIFYMIVNTFSHKKKPGLIILFVMNKSLEIDLHCTILFFSLIISLKVKKSGKLLLDYKEVT